MTVGSTSAVTRASWTRVATLASSVPARAARTGTSRRRARAAITPVVAVAETKPPARPAIITPRRAPNIRVAA